MFAVPTTIKVEEDSISELAALFDATNRQLVADHDDWLAAWFTPNEDSTPERSPLSLDGASGTPSIDFDPQTPFSRR